MAKMTDKSRGSGASSRYFAAYWANREPVRGRYADERDNPLRVEDVLLQAYEEGWPLKPVWLADEATPALRAADELTTVLPAVAADEPLRWSASGAGLDASNGFRGNDDPTEPNTAVRQGWKWLRPEGFTWWPTSLAG